MSDSDRPLICRPRIRRRPPRSTLAQRRRLRIKEAIQAVDLTMRIHYLALAEPRKPTGDTATCVDLYNAWEHLRRMIGE